MSEIKRLGGFWEISKEGHIINPGHIEHIAEPWLGLVESLRQACLSNCGDQLHSIYIRGSVTRGLAVPGGSVKPEPHPGRHLHHWAVNLASHAALHLDQRSHPDLLLAPWYQGRLPGTF